MAKKSGAIAQTNGAYLDNFNQGMSIPGVMEPGGGLQKRTFTKEDADNLKKYSKEVKALVKPTQQGYAAVVDTAKSFGEMHKSFRKAQVGVAKVVKNMAQSDAKAYEALIPLSVGIADGVSRSQQANTQAQQQVAAVGGGDYSVHFNGFQ